MFCFKDGTELVRDTEPRSGGSLVDMFETTCPECNTHFRAAADIQDNCMTMQEFLPEDAEIPDSAQIMRRLTL